MAKNICIIHFNTPDLTTALIHSINKCTPGATIYVFDNSNVAPFKNTFNNVIVFDNTKGQYIDFERVLEKYPLRFESHGKINNFGNAKHSMSIQKCVELIDANFILLDSDVLLKKDITPVFDENYVWVGGVEMWYNKSIKNASKKKRVCPFLLFMNVEKMKELKITFFDDKHMIGLNNGPKCEEYETGVWFYESTPEKYRKIINYADYIEHFRAASWYEDAVKKQNYKKETPQKWLERNKKLWLPAKTKIQEKNKVKNIDRVFYLYLSQKDIRNFNIFKEKLTKENKYQPSDVFKKIYNASQDDVKRYEILKEAKSLGYKNILLIEEPAIFNKNEEVIKKLFSNIPDDADIVLFDKMAPANTVEISRYKNYVKKISTGAMFGKKKDVNVPFLDSSCFYISEKAINKLLELQKEKILKKSDILNNASLNIYFSVENAAITDGHDKDYERIGIDIWKYKDKPKTPIQNKPSDKKPDINNATKPIRQNRFLAAKKPPVYGVEKKIQTSQKQNDAKTSKLALLRKKISTSNYNRLYDAL